MDRTVLVEVPTGSMREGKRGVCQARTNQKMAVRGENHRVWGQGRPSWGRMLGVVLTMNADFAVPTVAP
jgi:hypothetical protein